MSKYVGKKIFGFDINIVFQKSQYVLKKLPSSIKYIDPEKKVIITHRNDSIRFPGGELIILKFKVITTRKTEVEAQSESMDPSMVTFGLNKNKNNIKIVFNNLSLRLGL